LKIAFPIMILLRPAISINYKFLNMVIRGFGFS